MNFLDTRILFIFLCGYIIAYFSPLRFRSYDLQPSQLFLEAALSGFIIFIVSVNLYHISFIHSFAKPLSFWLSDIISPVYSINENALPNYIGIYSAWTLSVTVILCIVLRWFETKLPPWKKIPNAKWEILNEAVKNRKQLLIHLHSGKSYVGYVIRLPKIHQKQKSLKIMPLRSGYRSGTDYKLDLNNDYSETLYDLIEPYENPEDLPEDLEDLLRNHGVVIDSNDIQSLSLWYEELYNSL